MNIIIPPPSATYNQSSMGQAFDAIRRALLPGISKDEAVSRILLRSPNGTVYQVTVGDTGALSTLVISGKTHV